MHFVTINAFRPKVMRNLKLSRLHCRKRRRLNSSKKANREQGRRCSELATLFMDGKSKKLLQLRQNQQRRRGRVREMHLLAVLMMKAESLIQMYPLILLLCLTSLMMRMTMMMQQRMQRNPILKAREHRKP